MPGNQKGECQVPLCSFNPLVVELNPTPTPPKLLRALTSLSLSRSSFSGVRRRLQVSAQLRGGGRHRAPAGLRPHRPPFLQPGASGSPGAAEEGPAEGR